MSHLETPFSVVRRPVKHARLRVREDTSVELIIPKDFTQNEIEKVLDRKAEWIERKRAFFRSHPPLKRNVGSHEIILFGQLYRFILASELGREVNIDVAEKIIRSGRNLSSSEEQSRWFRAYAQEYLTRRISELSRVHNLPYGRLFIRSQRTKWGNCSPEKNISLNRNLILAPEYVIDYVILHELTHVRVPNHSQRFWVYLSAICPQFRKAIDWLNKNRPDVLV